MWSKQKEVVWPNLNAVRHQDSENLKLKQSEWLCWVTIVFSTKLLNQSYMNKHELAKTQYL